MHRLITTITLLCDLKQPNPTLTLPDIRLTKQQKQPADCRISFLQRQTPCQALRACMHACMQLMYVGTPIAFHGEAELRSAIVGDWQGCTRVADFNNIC